MLLLLSVCWLNRKWAEYIYALHESHAYKWSSEVHFEIFSLCPCGLNMPWFHDSNGNMFVHIAENKIGCKFIAMFKKLLLAFYLFNCDRLLHLIDWSRKRVRSLTRKHAGAATGWPTFSFVYWKTASSLQEFGFSLHSERVWVVFRKKKPSLPSGWWKRYVGLLEIR